MTFVEDWERSRGIQIQKKAEPKKPGGLGGFLSSLLPTGGGVGGALAGAAGGAALGSAVPIVGTAIGGLLGAIAGGAGGSAVGKFGQNALEGKQDLGEGVGEEALIGGLTSTPITGGLKLLKGAAKAPFVEGAFKKGVQEAGASAIPNRAVGLREKAALEIGGDNTAKTGVLSRLQKSAQAADAKASGIGTGKAINGKTITPKRSDELYTFGRERGVASGTPQQQAESAQRLFDDSSRALDESLTRIDRPITGSEITQLRRGVRDRVKNDAAVTSTTKTQDAFDKKIMNARSVKELEDIRKEADTIAYNARGANKTSAAAQARHVRETIDEFVTGLDDGYKMAKSDFINSKDLLELMSKNAGAKQQSVSVLGTTIPVPPVVPGAISKGTGLLARSNKDAAAKAAEEVMLPKGQGVLGAVTRESLLGTRPSMGAEAMPDEAAALDEAALAGADLGLGAEAEVDETAQIQERIKTAALQALAAGDTKGLENIVKVAGLLESFAGPAAKRKTEAQVAREEAYGISQDALKALDEGGVATGPVLGALEDFKGIFNAGDQKSIDFNRKVGALRSAIVKARGGSAVTDTELRLIDEFVPKKGDSDQVLRSKLQYIADTFGKASADFEPNTLDEITAQQ